MSPWKYSLTGIHECVLCTHTHRTWNYASRDGPSIVLRTESPWVSEQADSLGRTH